MFSDFIALVQSNIGLFDILKIQFTARLYHTLSIIPIDNFSYSFEYFHGLDIVVVEEQHEYSIGSMIVHNSDGYGDQERRLSHILATIPIESLIDLIQQKIIKPTDRVVTIDLRRTDNQPSMGSIMHEYHFNSGNGDVTLWVRNSIIEQIHIL